MGHHYLTKVLVAVSMISATLAAGSGWNYKRGDPLGPEMWAVNFTESCAGVKNSPIALVANKASQKAAEDWVMTGWNESASWTVEDNGHTIKFTIEDGFKITTSGGSLGAEYTVAQFHLHWGSNNSVGSEHTLNGNRFPLELHFVHYKSEHGNLSVAIASEEPDALAAVGFFFKIQDDDNDKFEQAIDYLDELREAANGRVSEQTGYMLNPLTDFGEEPFSKRFFRYDGGLTTPTCNEIVRWTVFETPIGISAAQMAKIRDQRDNHPDGTEYYRDPVPLGGRTVTLYDPEYVPDSASLSSALWSLTLLSVVAQFF